MINFRPTIQLLTDKRPNRTGLTININSTLSSTEGNILPDKRPILTGMTINLNSTLSLTEGNKNYHHVQYYFLQQMMELYNFIIISIKIYQTYVKT